MGEGMTTVPVRVLDALGGLRLADPPIVVVWAESDRPYGLYHPSDPDYASPSEDLAADVLGIQLPQSMPAMLRVLARFWCREIPDDLTPLLTYRPPSITCIAPGWTLHFGDGEGVNFGAHDTDRTTELARILVEQAEEAAAWRGKAPRANRGNA